VARAARHVSPRPLVTLGAGSGSQG